MARETTMTEETRQVLKNLRLTKILEILDEELATAQTKDSPHEEFLLRLLRAQWYYGQEKALEYRKKRARLPFDWSLKTFPFKKQPGVSRRLINSLATLDFIPRTENIIFIGKTGMGKTGLMTGLLLQALESGYRAHFVKAQDLFDEMYASLADRSTPNLVRQLAKVDLLGIDELGYTNVRPEQANVFFRLMEERYMRKPTIITTNLEYDEWHHHLGNPSMVEALLSRLLHRCQTIRIDGPSLR
jgi:DNA replication protein DnaC